MDMILLFLLVGCITGFFAGLLGIGGGAIIVPVVMYVVSQQAIPTDMVMKIALSTSFSVIIFSTASSAYSHNKHKAILWQQFPLLSIGTIIGMLVGTFLVQKMSNTILQIVFCIFMVYTIYGLLTKKKEAERIENVKDPIVSKTALTSGGSLIGFISSFIGIAGGTITIPLLSHWGFNTRKCIATSSMIGVIIASIFCNSRGFIQKSAHPGGEERADFFIYIIHFFAYKRKHAHDFSACTRCVAAFQKTRGLSVFSQGTASHARQELPGLS